MLAQNSPYYKDGRYRNLYESPGGIQKNLLDVLKWKLIGPRDKPAVHGVPKHPAIVQRLQDAAELDPKDAAYKVTYLGHATVFISIRSSNGFVRLITDPIFGHVPLVKRQAPLPIEKEKLPPVDFVLVSHSHYDHCDLSSLLFLQAKNPNALFLFPDGFEAWASRNKIQNFLTRNWFETYHTTNLRFHWLPVHHWGMRTFADAFQMHWASFAVSFSESKAEANLYFGGDTGFSNHFDRIRDEFPCGFEAAILPIGAYAPRWFMKEQHINPPEALLAAEKLGAKVLLPIHWGVFRQADEALLEPIYFLRDIASESSVKSILWTVGEAYPESRGYYYERR